MDKEMLKMLLDGASGKSAKICIEKPANSNRVQVEMQGTIMSLMTLSASAVKNIADRFVKDHADVCFLMAYRHMLNEEIDRKIMEAFHPDWNTDDKPEEDENSMSNPENIENLLNAMFGGTTE